MPARSVFADTFYWLDKGYSLTDCSSMCVMKTLGITDVLTHDKHFAQEGFHLLFPNQPTA